MRSLRRFMLIALLAVAGVSALGVAPSFADLKAAPTEVQITAPGCACEHGCADAGLCRASAACAALGAVSCVADIGTSILLPGTPAVGLVALTTAPRAASHPPPLPPPNVRI